MLLCAGLLTPHSAPTAGLLFFFASSAESMGGFWFGEAAEVVE